MVVYDLLNLCKKKIIATSSSGSYCGSNGSRYGTLLAAEAPAAETKYNIVVGSSNGRNRRLLPQMQKS